MASLSTCHLGLWLGWQILLNLVKSSSAWPPSSAIRRVGAVEEVDDEDANRRSSSYASSHSCTFSVLTFIIASSGTTLPVLVTPTFSLSSYKENGPSNSSISDTVLLTYAPFMRFVTVTMTRAPHSSDSEAYRPSSDVIAT